MAHPLRLRLELTKSKITGGTPIPRCLPAMVNQAVFFLVGRGGAAGRAGRTGG